MVYDNHVWRTNKGVQAAQLGKRFGALWALRGVDLDVPPGAILGLLGHNGAGKTTALRILTTLATPTEGRAAVAGFDVVTDAAQVRARIGVAGQAATVDGLLTARANLEMVARLYHLGRDQARRRAGELLERLELGAAADQRVGTLSGGTRRRLDLAASLIAGPPVLFLDEPTTGLDPHARNQLWELLRERVRGGATLVLTTQYLEEADRLADEIVVLDHGRIAARGTPSQLKARIGGARVVVTVGRGDRLAAARAALERFRDGEIAEEAAAARLVVPVLPGTRIVELVRALDAAGVDIDDVHRREVTLDDVFLAITSGRAPETAGAPGASAPEAA
jgi:ABC-2 type transport system ATP-binding protein